MSGWKPGLEFQQMRDSKNDTAPSRYNIRGGYDPKKKGTFQKRIKMEDAPSLMTVVNAKPEIKQKATEQVVIRAKKKEERRKMKARVIVQKLSPRPARRTWTSVLSKNPDTPISKSLLKATSKNPAGYKPPPGSVKSNWKTAYEDILSPTSGRHKMVARQDLVHKDDNKILSPKKKARSPARFPIPALPLDEDDDEEQPKKSSQVKPSLIIDDESSSDEEAEQEVELDEVEIRAVTPPLDEQAEEENYRKQKATQDDHDDFVDVESDRSSDIEAESEANFSKTKSQAGKTSEEKPKVKQQLILEFALPGDEGEEEEEEGLQVPVDIESFDDLSSVGSWPSIESQDSYDTKMNKMMQRWMDVHGDYNDEDRTLYDNDVDLEDNVLDHVVLAVPDLDDAMDQFEEMTGIRPTPVGPLQGLGAKTAHIGLDENRYIELLAPDLENPGPLGDELALLGRGTMTPYHYSIRSSEVSRLIEGYVYDVLGWDPDHIAMVQALPDNSIRHWDLLTMYGHDVGGAAPCYVRWKDPAQHPTASIALKATLTSCIVRAPEDHDVHKLITGVGGLTVQYGDPLLEVTFMSPKGSLTFSTKNPKGLVFPGYDNGHHISQMPDLPVSGDRTVDEDYCDVGSDSESSAQNK
jgi:hypothetical protein